MQKTNKLFLLCRFYAIFCVSLFLLFCDFKSFFFVLFHCMSCYGTHNSEKPKDKRTKRRRFSDVTWLSFVSERLVVPMTDNKSENSSGSDAFECSICLEQATEPVVTLCGHLFWFVHAPSVFSQMQLYHMPMSPQQLAVPCQVDGRPDVCTQHVPRVQVTHLSRQHCAALRTWCSAAQASSSRCCCCCCHVCC